MHPPKFEYLIFLKNVINAYAKSIGVIWDQKIDMSLINGDSLSFRTVAHGIRGINLSDINIDSSKTDVEILTIITERKRLEEIKSIRESIKYYNEELLKYPLREKQNISSIKEQYKRYTNQAKKEIKRLELKLKELGN